MAKENLLQPTINARDFQPIEIGARPKSRVEQKYEDLKGTDFYNREEGYWKEYPFYPRRTSHDQLLGVLIEEKYNRSTAEGQYRSLKEGPLYMERKNLWKLSVGTDANANGIVTSSQLLGMLVESKFDKENTQQNYELLKENSDFYDKESGQWVYHLDGYTGNFQSEAYDILIQEQLFDKKAAKDKYEKLKLSEFYSDKHKKWTSAEGSFTSQQLLGILIEGKFDKENAKKQYQALKQSKFFNKERNLWNVSDNEDRFYSEDQLLGILVEQMFEEKPEEFKQEKGIPIPEIRVF